MILADSSAWIEYDRATRSRADRRMADLIATDGPLAVTEPVVMELLAGVRSDEDADRVRRLALRCRMLRFDPASDFDAAARIYRRCRVESVTPRGMVDCMIAAVAWRRGAALLAKDADMVRIAHVAGIDLDPASRG